MKLQKDKIGRNILLVVATRKLTDSFKIPLQGKYLSDILNFETEYQMQEGGSENSANQIADDNKRK